MFKLHVLAHFLASMGSIHFSHVLCSTPVKIPSKVEAVDKSLAGKSAVIIGGGPVGLAASLALEKCGWTDITIVEKRSEESFENSKAYLYMIDGRGIKITDVLGMNGAINKRGTNSHRDVDMMEVKTNGERKTTSFKRSTMAGGMKYFIPRSEFLNCFFDSIKKSSNIKVLFSSGCNKIERDNSGKVVLSIGNDRAATASQKILTPDLLLGCDGQNSVVRKWLSENEGRGGKDFNTVTLPSPSGGMKYKMFVLKKNFPLPHQAVSGVTEMIPGSESTSVTPLEKVAPIISRSDIRYIFWGTGTTINTRMRIGVFSAKEGAMRTGNICLHPDHEFWKLKTFEEVKECLTKGFPQIDFSSFVSDEELARFAAATPGEFPTPQYAKGIQQLYSHTKADGSQGVCGVALAGDAVHAFPPDLGQGVNAGLEDVWTLYNELSQSDNDLEKALKSYEDIRLPEAQAICRIMQFGAPFQYNQAPRKGMVYRTNFALRVAISSALPLLFSPPAAYIMMRNPDLKYEEILRRVHATTRNIVLIAAAPILTLGWLAKKYF